MCFQFFCVGSKTDDVKTVFRVLTGDQIVQRERHFFGRLERTAQGHRPGQIHQHRRRRGGDHFGAINFEVIRREADGCAGAIAVDGIANSPWHVEVERIAKFIAFGFLDPLTKATLFGNRMIAETLPLQALVDFPKRFLADYP